MKNKSDARNRDASSKQSTGTSHTSGKKFSPKTELPPPQKRQARSSASSGLPPEEQAPRYKRQDGPKPRPAAGAANLPRTASKVLAKPGAAKGTPVAARPEHKGAQPKAQHHERVAADKRPARPERGDREQKPTLHCGQTLELKIISTNNDGFGVAMHEGTRVLVAGGLPGELLVSRVTYVGRREAFGNTLKCVKTSPDRELAPACGLGRACDGCGLMQMRYPAQLAWKTDLVKRELRRFSSLSDVRIHDTIASPKALNYRNTAKLVVAGKFSDPVIGIYRRNSHDVLEIEDCQLHHPLINKVVKTVKAGIKKGKVPIYNPKSEMGLLRYLVVRVAEPSDKVMVVFVTSEQGYNEMHHLAKFVQQEIPEVSVVAQNINSSAGNVIFGHKDRFITKRQTLRASIGDKNFNLSPHSFFQVNSGSARIIYEKVRELAALTGTERVIDVYCGIGGISLFLADKAREVVGIEFVEAAVADATENAALNGAKNCSFEAGDAAHLIDEIGEEGGADLVVLNPPRKGCDERVLKSVATIGPERIIYVSCSPETLARDLDILSRLGYRTREVHPVDMFPQTVHVEDVALIEKIKDDSRG
jgi:23S rRNA (uracil1939-C5)-methyltransferase